MHDAPTPKRLKKADRRRQILLELRLSPHVRVADLAVQFGVTTETVRRDMDDLGAEGLLTRAHGGASAPAPGHRSMHERRLDRVTVRERLGRFAATLVADGDTIMIDAGTTTMEFARELALTERRVTAITNSLQVAMTLGRSPAARVLVAPGTYMPEEAATVGTEACEYLSSYNVDACFLGAAGLCESGVTEVVEGFSAIKRTMMRQSGVRRFLIDSSKFGRAYLSRVARCEEIEALVTDARPDASMAKALGTGTQVIVSPPSIAGQH